MPRVLKRRVAVSTLPGLSPLLSRLYVGRGVVSKDEVDHSLKNLLPPDLLKGMGAAVELLAGLIRQQARILIIGDFDADGATSSVLMVHGLRSLGAEQVDYLVPNRFEYGYGLTPEIVEVALQRNPDLIVTVDNGISSHEGVDFARENGIKTLITDHHLPGNQVPKADAILNPNQQGCDFPSKNLAGVGVAFYLLSGVRRELRESHWFEHRSEPNMADYLDLVALGTIADVVPMDYNNRIMVQEGIRRIRAGRLRPGLKALSALSGNRIQTITSSDLAFGVAPRVNAAGRLEDISLGIECLLADDENRAQELASRLDKLNLERREIENEMKQQALNFLSALKLTKDTEEKVGICLYDEGWHQGVVGVVASRIKDEFHRPVVAFAKVSDSELKGSARSISGLHMRDVFETIAARNPDLLQKFGGHAMAAGLTLHPANLTTFAEQFDIEAKRWLTEEDLTQTVITDGNLGEDYSISLAREIGQICPWGQGFPEPLFDDDFEIVDQRIVGGRHLKMKLRPLDGADSIDAIAFNHDRLVEGRVKRIAYRLDVNEYRGMESLQLIVDCVDIKLDQER
ncbi:MAG TPA: single-stranded-DNA-specific exonuclease RecJ [Pseudomonadales bacterium]|jgi:single-stranded-DNA-specific exonuclease|nr:single-stranded-DNA-specific exonuclease RecJ [Gammaproteobacteria bacterium]MDP6025933.1 single-stranded-DNA-specific exonuclease RecJ [Pseudomonadales bacterium]MDP6316796.1 single-stranded-DNA-specific exonuclease RecJ [Pseudomonadales bacterium]MDP7314590.1 single-stranded-DNA-specific exonuclease RecJ [Pseudomonadales bacterium]MDP7577689.1 single-stranded-DNA-specific exonuclease RecJ [Pseudomonadales bacterium]|tara:strand:- start:3548 stop:5263 length:1716 start_codon:yes stop_codon:yes gene_type:complete